MTTTRQIPVRVELAAKRILAGRGDAYDRRRAVHYAGIAWGLRVNAHQAAVEIAVRVARAAGGRPA